MVATTTIRRIDIRASTTGVDESRQKLTTLDQAMLKMQRTLEQSNRLNEQAMQAQRQLAATQTQSLQSMTAANDNYSRSSEALSTVLRAGAKAAVEQGASWLATAAKTALVAAAFTALAAIIGPLYIAYKVLKTVVDLFTDAIDLSAAALERYRNIARDAAATDLSTSFFQRITKAATDAKLPVDTLTAAMKKLSENTTEKLGGSELQNRIDKLSGAGNLQGNSGVGALSSAATTEEKFRAVVSLIDQAMKKGERLAALDIAEKAFGSALTENLRKDSEYLTRMLADADRINQMTLVSPEEIGRAIELQARYDAAAKILSERWHPLQETLTNLGIKMREVWVGIVEAIAEGAVRLERFVSFALKLPSAFWDNTKRVFATVTGTGEQYGPAFVDPKATATDALRAGLQNPNALTQARDQTNAASALFRRDTSINPDVVKTQRDTNDAVDAAINSLRRHAAVQEADAQAIGLGAGALARFRAEAQFTAAVQANGGKVTAEQAAEFEKLKRRAEEAAVALAKARINDQISFGRQTAILSPEDVSIAQQLRSIYPDVATALGSVEAAGLRTNAALSGLSSSMSSTLTTGLTDILDGTKSVKDGFSDMSKAVIRAIQEMIVKLYIVGPLMRGLQGLMGGGSGGITFGTSSGPTPFFAEGGYTGNGTKYQPAGIVHAGEFVFSQSSVNRLGLGYLNALHQHGTRGYASGGPVMPAAANNNAGAQLNVVVNHAPSSPNVSSKRNASGGHDVMIDFRDAVRGMVAEDAANNGPMSKALSARAGGFNGR